MRTKIWWFFALSFVAGFLLISGHSADTWAQGFKKLNVNDKFGTSNENEPIKPQSGNETANASNAAADDGVYFNGTDLDIKDMISQISALTGRNFIINDKVRGKITIISDKKMTKDEVYQAFLSSLEINGFTTVMTPAGLINIVPQKDSLNKPVELYTEQSPNTDKYITRIIQLVNISANEVSNVIKGMVSKNGNLFAYPTTNSLIITDTGSNITHILDLIKQLDQEGPQEVMEMIPIINADAKDIADKITQIFDKESKDDAAKTRVKVRRPGQTSEMEDVQSISKVISDERTNSVLIMGTKRSIGKVKDLIDKLDRAIGGAEGKIHVYYLKYAKSEDVSSVLSSVVSGAASTSKSGKSSKSSKSASASSSSSATAAKGASSSSSGGSVTLEGGVQVTADPSTNSLVIVASPKDFETLVSQVISKLDILRPQVYLEAVIMSLDVKKTSQIGISGLGGMLNTLTGGNTLSAFGGLMPITPDAISTLAGASGGFGGGMFSSDTIDVTLTDGSTFSVPAVSGILMALASDTDANVLSTPSIMTLDNEEAKIQVGQEVPVPSGTSMSSGVTSVSVTREDTGIILTITPQISENDSIRLNINQEITGVYTTDASLGPTLDKKSVETVVVAKNRQTIVIGGLIDDKQTVTTHKVPFFGDIPVLGNLFRTRINQKDKSNLLVFITPYIIRERKDYLAILKKKIEERNRFVDMNYGRTQKKSIRKAIQDHALDLLEFKCQSVYEGDPCYVGAVPVTGAVYAPVRSHNKKTASAAQTNTFEPVKVQSKDEYSESKKAKKKKNEARN